MPVDDQQAPVVPVVAFHCPGWLPIISSMPWAVLAFLNLTTSRHLAERHAVIATVMGLISAVSILFSTRLSISAAGVRLYRINFLRWDAIVDVRPTRFLGVPYLSVRSARRRLWIPLYVWPRAAV